MRQAVWTLTVDGTTVKIQDANNTYIAPKGGNNNGIVSGEYAWSWKFENGVFTFSGQGEDTVVLASNKSSQNRFRAYKTTTVSGTPGGYPSEFTLYKAEVGSEPGEDTVAAPQSSPQAGEVTSGTEITLSTTTSGASIYYTLNGDDPTTSSAQYSDDNKPKIEGTVGAEVILKAVAVLDGVYSAVQTLQYTIIEEDQPATESPIEAGDQVVIYAPAYNMALSSQKTGYYNLGVEVSFTDDVLTGYGTTEVWTVVDNEDGTYSFQQNNQNIGLGESFASMDLNAVNDKWEIISLGNGLYNIKNTGRGNYMEWYEQYGNWSTYETDNAAADERLQMSFYKVTEEPTDPNPESPIADGERVVIYNPAYNKALSSEKTGNYNVGTDVTVSSDGTLSGYTAVNIWIVVDNNDGTFSFQQEGQNIGINSGYSSMGPGVEDDDWKIIDLGDGLYNIQNATRNNYMEWYAQYSNWSTYNSSSAATDDQFQLSFYKVTGDIPEPEPEAPFEAGDTVVIYAPSNNMALSAAVKSQYYPVGVAVEVSGDTITGYGNTEIWTVGGNAESGWTFTSNGGKTLSMAGSYSSVYPGAGENETWILEAAGPEGQYYVKNEGRGNYLFWDDEYDDWTTRTEEKTAVTFVVVEPPEEEPEVEGLEVRATPASGASLEEGDTIELTAAEGTTIYYTTDGSHNCYGYPKYYFWILWDERTVAIPICMVSKFCSYFSLCNCDCLFFQAQYV